MGGIVVNKVAPGLCILIGLYWTAMGLFKYNLWVNKGPGGGVFAVFAGLIMIVCGTIVLLRFIKSKEKSVMEKDAILMIIAAILTAVMVAFGALVAAAIVSQLPGGGL